MYFEVPIVQHIMYDASLLNTYLEVAQVKTKSIDGTLLFYLGNKFNGLLVSVENTVEFAISETHHKKN